MTPAKFPEKSPSRLLSDLSAVQNAAKFKFPDLIDGAPKAQPIGPMASKNPRGLLRTPRGFLEALRAS